MRVLQVFCHRVIPTCAALAVLPAVFWATPAHAGTIAYYTFENGTNNQVATTPVIDQTGQNPLTVEAGSDAHYSSNVPFSSVPSTDTPDTLSMDFTSLPALTSNSSETTFNDFNFPTWTIEASVDFKALSPVGGSAFQTFVGKNSHTTFADFYLQRNDRNGGFSVLYTGANGQAQGFDSSFLPQINTWYNVAAVYNGTNISLYVNDTLVQSAPALGLISENTPWTIGNGWSGATTDASDAYVDNVRFSSTALSPSQFLAAPAVPEPAAFALISLGLLPVGLAVGRRRRGA